MPDSLLGHFWEHAVLVVGGATGLGIIAHAVNTFPTPTNKYGAWFLGVIQFLVGQRVAAANTLRGQDTQTFAVIKTKEPGE